MNATASSGSTRRPATSIDGRRSARRSSVASRAIDLAIAVPLSLLTLPAVVVLACASAVSFRAWPFFVQKRIGTGGRLFWFVKIRSLPASAPASADKYELASVTNTRFGRFVRRSHLDELPQLWLVVSGRMSTVGPRPEMPSLAATFDPDFVAARQRVRPGCTGLWQISPASGGLISEGSEYDLFYIEHASLRLDLWIIYRTVRAMAGGGRRNPVDPPLWALRGAVMIEPSTPSSAPAVTTIGDRTIDLDRADLGQGRRSGGVVWVPSTSRSDHLLAGEPG